MWSVAMANGYAQLTIEDYAGETLEGYAALLIDGVSHLHGRFDAIGIYVAGNQQVDTYVAGVECQGVQT
jgi:hypothetical protein